MEAGSVREIFYSPMHPYTWGLQVSLPKHDGSGGRLRPIEGTPPDLLEPPAGCPFADRCEYAMEICHRRMPDVTQRTPTHNVRCWLYHEMAPKVTNPITGGTT